MAWIELFLIGLGLSMDAFSVAVCKGLQMRRIRWSRALTVALMFGGFQALMPLIGWLLGKQFEQYIVAVDHWIAFFLLCFIGGKMILDVLRERGKTTECSCGQDGETSLQSEPPFRIGELLLMALATSIDALAMGITFAFLQVDVRVAVVTIGVTTFVLSIVGVLIGNVFGARYRNKATLAGGAVLVVIGTKILIEHLFFV